jgi:hypothetical protein
MLSLKTDVNEPTESNKQKSLNFLGDHLEEKSRIWIRTRNQVHKSKDPNPDLYQNVTDQEYWLQNKTAAFARLVTTK